MTMSARICQHYLSGQQLAVLLEHHLIQFYKFVVLLTLAYSIRRIVYMQFGLFNFLKRISEKLTKIRCSVESPLLVLICMKGIFLRRSQSKDTLIFYKLKFGQHLNFLIFK